MKVLITGAVSVQAHQLHRHLGTVTDVIFADSGDVPQVMNSQKIIKIPAGNSVAFAHNLLTLCLDLGIGKIYPLRRSEVHALAEAKTLFDEYGIRVIVPDKANISGLLNEKIAGKIFVNEEGASDIWPDRGIFLLSEPDRNIQLFIAD